MSVTALREKDWVFNAFWVACGEPAAPKCTVRVPVTCLFKNGKPFKTLGSDELGIVRRINLEDIPTERLNSDRGVRGPASKTLNALRKVLIEYSDKNGYQQAQEERGNEGYICNTIYLNGEIEKLTLQKLDILLRADTWVKQVLIIQGFVPTYSVQVGIYSHAPKVRSKVTSNNNEAADNFARAIAKYAERAYLVGAEELMGRTRSLTGKTVTLKVMDMQCQFALDPHDNIVFLYADYTAVEIENGRKEVEDYMAQEKVGRQTSAAQSVAKELLGKLHHAGNRGLPVEASFEHFDPSGVGYFNTDMLIDGLARLSIGVTYPVGEGVLEIIGGIGSQFVTIQEFKQFLEAPIDIRTFDSFTPNANTQPSRSGTAGINKGGAFLETGSSVISGTSSRKSGRNTSTVSGEAKLSSPPKRLRGAGATKDAPADPALRQLLPPLKEASFDSDFMNLAASQLYDWKVLMPQETGAGKSSAKQQRQKSEAEAIPLELPLPLSAYTTTGPQQRQDAVDKGSSKVGGLAPWASKRSQRALHQLRNAQVRAEKKAQSSSRDSAQHSMSLSSSLSQLPLSGVDELGSELEKRGSPPPRSAEARSRSRGSTPSKSPQRSGKSRGKPQVEPLSLQGIVQSMTDEDVSRCTDELLHVDHGVIMTYRILNGPAKHADELRTHEKSDALRYRSYLQDREKTFQDNKETAKESKGTSSRPGSPAQISEPFPTETPAASGLESSFTLVILPDLFMTLDTLQEAFMPLLSKFPYAQLVLVGLPGMPNTVWPSNWVLNADLHARSMAKLMHHLVHNRLLMYGDSPDAARVPLFFMGFGHSTVSLSRFLTLFLPSIPALQHRSRAVCLVNGLLRYSKKFKNVCKDLWQTMQHSDGVEVNELISSLHFDDNFLAKNGRKTSLEQFWSSRRGLQMERIGEEITGLSFLGVLEQLKGILLSSDDFDGAQMLLTDIPVVVVQSSEDVFVDPRNAAIFTPEQLPPQRSLVSNIADALDQSAVLVQWLQCGHEVVQERPTFLLGLLSQLAQICGIRPVNAPTTATATTQQQQSSASVEEDLDELFDVLDLAGQGAVDHSTGTGIEDRAKLTENGTEGSDSDAGLTEEEKREKAHQRKEQERERALIAKAEARRLTAELAAEEERIAAEAAQQEEEERQAAKLRKTADRISRTKNALDSKSRELKQSREVAMESLRKKEQADKDHRNECRECLKMAKEDVRSKYAEEYHIECQIAETSKKLAKIRAEELAMYRKEEAIKRVEENMARKRAEYIEERRLRAQNLVESIQKEELTLSGEKTSSGYHMPMISTTVTVPMIAVDDNSNTMNDNNNDTTAMINNRGTATTATTSTTASYNIPLIIETSNNIMKDLLECRQYYIEALKRQQLIEEKVMLFRKQLGTVENDERRLRRAIRLLEFNPSIISNDMNIDTQLEELRSNLSSKQETLNELTAVSKQRELQLQVANNSIQNLKIKTTEIDTLMQNRVNELYIYETNINNNIKRMKLEKEKMIIQRDRLRIEVINYQKRIDIITTELIRIKEIKGKLVDTDIYVQGVMQRCLKQELKIHLLTEEAEVIKKRDKILVELNTIRDHLFHITEKISLNKRDLNKITSVTKVLYKTYKQYNSISINQIMLELNKKEKMSNTIENKRKKENELEKEFTRAGSSNTVDRVRLKESDIRTKEERQFVGIDLVMNPEAYMHISIVEAEQMQFDEDYQCSLSKSDLERIVKLPEQIQLALPFLHTAEEVNAHKLLNIFLREKTESYFQDLDYTGELPGLTGVESLDGSDEISRSTHDGMSFILPPGQSATGVNSAAVRTAEIMHEVLVRESLRDRLRASGPGDNLTEDEQKWLVLDRVLSPHVYNTTEQPLDAIPPVVIRTVDNTLNTSINKNANTKGPRTEKEKFDLLRAGFEAGEDVFNYSWKSPFDRNQLLAIRKARQEDLKTPEEVYTRVLIDKYYVDSRESTLGHSTLKLINHMIGKVARVVAAVDKEANIELQSIRSNYTEEADDATTLKSGHSFASARSTLYGRRGNSSMNASGHEIQEIEAGETIARVWGSWNEVHPASAGKESQTSFFQLSTFDASRDHPACFAARPEDEVGEDLSDDEDTEAAVVVPAGGSMPSDEDGGDLFAALLGSGSPGKAAKRQKNDPHSHFHIAESIPELATSDPRKLRGKVVLMMIKQPMQLLEVKNAALQSRQSRSHYFTLPSRDSVRALDITVSIVFKGDFAGKGYRLGRLAAGLFRLPPENPDRGRGKSSASVASAPPIPEAVGYAPYHLQSPNLPDAMGRIVILHRPRTRPLPPGTFQIVVGAAANTKYSIEVTCNIGKTALPIVDEAITQARQHQSRLPTCIMEIEGIEESIRLAERKLLVCEKMIQEAELESERSQKGMRIITKQLERDDEEMTLMEDERRDLQRELSIFEIEYSQWASTFATRSREKDDIKEGIRMMYSFKRNKIKEKEDIKTKLKEARRDLPACMVILRNTTEAVNVAMSLNTIVQGVTEEVTAATAGDFGGIQVSTPAEDVRRNLKQYGLKSLSLEEQQWCVLDQALNPQKYEWQREAEEKERVEREAMGKQPKEKKFNPAIEDFRLSKVEIEYILDTPFSMLSRKEVIIRKLLTKYHDDREALQKSIATVAYAFDPHLAERIRAKNPKSYTSEEKNWSAVDRVLHPEIWEFYVNRQENYLDRHERESANANARYKAKKAQRQQELSAAAVENRQRSVSEEVLGELTQTLAASGAGSNLLQSRHSTRMSRSSKITAVGSKDTWKCPFNREEILRIWRTPRHFLKTDDEREIYKLLQKYNGTYTSYMDAITHAKRRQGHFVKEGSHIQWEKLGKLVSKDVDFRARQLLREIDRATFTRNDWISSDVLHANDQKFPTRVLRMHLEEALDVLLTEQIRDRERAEKIRVDSSDSEDEEDAAVLLALEQTDDVSLDSDDGTGGAPGDTEILNKVRRRAERREKRKRKLKKLSEEKEVMKVKKVLAKKKTGVALAEAILQNQLGVGGCLACRTKKCKWQPSVDVAVCTARKKVLDEELERIRLDRDAAIFESDVVLSVQLGGNRVFKRQDLVEELTFEQRELGQRIDLNNIDLELHDAYATRKEYFESKYLHGYSLLLWTNNARQALEMRQSRLCALSVAKEVVDDILDWMLEGWFFGERESQFKVLGYVPSIKATGKVRAGQDQISSVTQVVAKMRTRAENRRNNIVTSQSTQGAMLEKAWNVEEDSQHKLKELKVARDGNEHEHMLNETETTLKFGIFMMTLMYFRAMTFLRREQKSWSGEGEEIGVKSKGQNDKIMTDERMRMLDEENKAAARKKKVDIVLARCKIGEARRSEREAAERREAILRLQAVVRRQKLELESISCIQKVFRGHIGRKAAKRWALKRAELGAMNALLNSTAIAIQRVFRGYEGRLYAIQKRTEMAQFIALMRVQESQQDEEIYWQTHPWSRFKKNQREWMQEKMEKYKSSGTMGGSRLSAAEQAQLEGRSLEEIRRQIEGLDEVPDDEEEEDENDGTSTVAGFSEYNDHIERSTVEG